MMPKTINRVSKLTMILLVFGFLALVGCQTTPPATQVFETKDNFTKKTAPEAKTVPIDERTILVDARPPFAHSLSHPSRSLSIQWSDFTEKEAPFEGTLEKDLFFHARRLARMGIGPDSDILVLGSGRAGTGEEGRLAWTFRRMGLKKVRFASLESIRATMTNQEAPPPTEVPTWKPQEDASLEIKRLDAIAEIQKEKAEILVIDVREEKDYLASADLFHKMNLAPKLINIPWAEFLNEFGTASTKVEAKLRAIGVAKSARILVIDEKGVKSAGATLVLRDLGFTKATNWAGGFREINWFLQSQAPALKRMSR